MANDHDNNKLSNDSHARADSRVGSTDPEQACRATGYTSDAIRAMEYVIANRIRVSNNSWGSSSYTQALYDVIAASQRVGHIFVASAGNDSSDTDVVPHYPASYDLPNIISVAATDNDDNLGTFPSGASSNYGLTTVDLGAPGVSIYSTTMHSAYSYKNGTSMAAPHVTGVAALVMSRFPALSWEQARHLVLTTVRPIEALDGITVTGGVVDAASAIDDCNGNHIPDRQDIAFGVSEDCSGNDVPDECEPDCNGNGVADSCDIVGGTSVDCNSNGVPDDCDLSYDGSQDCNGNDVPDECDAAGGTSDDCDYNTVPDECEPDCNQNNVTDRCDILTGSSIDCNENGIPDDCIDLEIDCNDNLVPDSCDIAEGTSQDEEPNGIPDECQSTYHVPSEYPTIQSAIDTAATGDAILVAEGEYTENLSIMDKSLLTIIGAGSRLTTIDGDQNGSVVTIENVESLMLAGLTLRNGSGNADGLGRSRGGGVSCHASTLTINDCVVADNTLSDAHNYGAGIYCGNCDLTIVDSAIVGNKTFGGNGYGIGIYAGSCELVAQNCIFSGNEDQSVYQAVGGGIMLISSSTGLLQNCTIAHNMVLQEGGGVWVGGTSPDPVFRNCIIYGNTAPVDPQIRGDEIYVAYSNVEGGWPGTGNIDADPLFVDPENRNYRLRGGSPCVDAGKNAYVLADILDLDDDRDREEPIPFDLDGMPRFIDDWDTTDTGEGAPPIVDLGAYEYQAADPIPTVSEWGMIGMAVLVIGTGAMVFGKRRFCRG